ncbi:MAG: hypothetical protein KA371_14620 [Acidobacteria bacterium]|jgi:hypothetical protein|nr:hypothetical protein [Acidobacteriota bacterium]
MDVAQLRKSVRQAIEGAKKDQAARRVRADAARLAYERFLEEQATPVFRTVANVLKSEGMLFDVMTPSGGVRLVPERTREDGIELTLDPTFDPPRVTLTTARSRGSRTMRVERALKDGVSIDTLTDDDVVAALLDELRPWLER